MPRVKSDLCITWDMLVLRKQFEHSESIHIIECGLMTLPCHHYTFAGRGGPHEFRIFRCVTVLATCLVLPFDRLLSLTRAFAVTGTSVSQVVCAILCATEKFKNLPTELSDSIMGRTVAGTLSKTTRAC